MRNRAMLDEKGSQPTSIRPLLIPSSPGDMRTAGLVGRSASLVQLAEALLSNGRGSQFESGEMHQIISVRVLTDLRFDVKINTSLNKQRFKPWLRHRT